MKIFTLLAAICLSNALWSQSLNVQLTSLRDSYTKGDTLSFEVSVNEDAVLEVSVFANDLVLLYSNDRLRAGEHTYRIPVADAKPGTYFILAKGEGVHEQKQVAIR